MSSVLKTVKCFLLKNAHAKTESNSRRKKVNEYIENDKSRLKMYCWSGLNGRDYDATGEHHLDQKNIQIENIEKYEEKDKQHQDNNKEKIREKKTRCKNKDTCYDKI